MPTYPATEFSGPHIITAISSGETAYCDKRACKFCKMEEFGGDVEVADEYSNLKDCHKTDLGYHCSCYDRARGECCQCEIMRRDMLSKNRTCPCCDGTTRNLLYTTPTQQTIVSCNRCKMVYANSKPRDYTKTPVYASYAAQAGHYRSIVANAMKSGISIRASVLDVGCATGGLMEAFINAGFTNVSGLSRSQAEVDCCIVKGLNVRVGSVEQWPNEEYDIVMLSHVLEQVPDVQGFLQHLKQWVKPHGSLYIEVPNALEYIPYFTSVTSSYQGFSAEHINHFDLKHLVHSCIEMEVYEKGSYNIMPDGQYLYPVIWVLAHPHASDLESAIEAYAQRIKELGITSRS